MPIAADMKLAAVQPYVIKKTLLQPDQSSDPALVLGVELEIENLAKDEQDRAAMAVQGMNYHSDGSLRNNGGEFVTLPMKIRELEYVLNQFFMKNKLTEDNYSERCSVHVHANVGDLTWEQLKTLTLVYLVFERLLFAYIGDERDKNIFCVPLYDTSYTSDLLSGKDVYGNKVRFGKWEKYTALNFLPMKTQGSIEFRHMGGTNDLAYIMEWCNIIGKMFVFARGKTWEDSLKFFMTLNTSSAYQEALNMVFGEYAGALQRPTHYTTMLEEGVLSMKYAIGVSQGRKKRSSEEEAELAAPQVTFNHAQNHRDPREYVFEMLNVPGQTRRVWQESDGILPNTTAETNFGNVVRVEVPLTPEGRIPNESYVYQPRLRDIGLNERYITSWRYISPEGVEGQFPIAPYPDGAKVYRWVRWGPPPAAMIETRAMQQSLNSGLVTLDAGVTWTFNEQVSF